MSSVKAPKLMDIVLIALEGDVDPGTEHLITPDEAVPIGRSAKGVTLLDPLVSIQHASVSFDLARGYIIQDLDSATGTWVDEERIKGESRPIGVGTVLRFGDSVFEVGRPTRVPLWLRVSVLVLLLILAFVGIATVLPKFTNRPIESALPESIVIHDRKFPTLLPDHSVLRKLGWSMRDLTAIRVTDYDNNGISEVWLSSRRTNGELVITFPELAPNTSTWEVLGTFPWPCVGSHGVSNTPYFPILNCEGRTYAIFEETDTYDLEDHEGYVVYYRQEQKGLLGLGTGAKAKAKGKGKSKSPPATGLGLNLQRLGPLKVARLSVKNVEQVAGFLTSRGAPGPVHYIICENAFDGIPAQAVMSNGVVQRLLRGCHTDLRLQGKIEGQPVAIALSASGHQGLIDDVLTFYAGHPDALFLESKRQPLAEALRTPPGFLKGNSSLNPNPFLEPAVFDPKPDRALPAKARKLAAVDLRVPRAPTAYTAPIPQRGLSEISLDYVAYVATKDENEDKKPSRRNCGKVRVRTNDFASGGLMTLLGRGVFSRIEDANTGAALLTIPYGSGTYQASMGGCQLRAVVETATWGQTLEVLRYRISYREKP